MTGDPDQRHTAVAIAGAGPVGLSLALMLARRGIATLVVDPKTVTQARADHRLLALSAGSWQILAPIIDRATMPPTAPIVRVRVSSAGEFGTTTLTAGEFGQERLGATVWYGDLVDALDAAARAEPLITLVRGETIASIDQQTDGVRGATTSGRRWRAALAVRAEGAPAAAATLAWAVLADAVVAIDGPARAGDAFERFTRNGPLALLPAPARTALSGVANQAAASTIWCLPQALAQRYATLDDAAFLGELQRQLGERTARIISVGPRTVAGLRHALLPAPRAHRIVAIGNAAQVLHPVAGQGLNLGLRDAAELSRCLAAAFAARRSDVADAPVAPAIDLDAALAEFARRRRLDRHALGLITARLPGWFATRWLPLAMARQAALASLDAVPAARLALGHLLMFGVRA